MNENHKLSANLTGWLGRLGARRFGLREVPLKIAGIILIAIFLPSLLMTGVGLLAVYRAEPIIREHIEFRFQDLLTRLDARIGREWEARHRHFDRRLRFESDVARLLERLPLEDDFVRAAGLFEPTGKAIPPSLESPFEFLEVEHPGPELLAARELEFQILDPASAAERYRRVLLGEREEEAMEALLGLSRVHHARSDWEGSMRALERLRERFGLTVDASGVPRGIPALLRMVELSRTYEQPIAELSAWRRGRRLLEACARWMPEAQVEMYRDRFARLERDPDSSPDAGGSRAPEPLPASLVDSLRERGLLTTFRAQLGELAPDGRSGYLRLGRGREAVIISVHRLEERGQIACLELDPDRYLDDIPPLTHGFEIQEERLEFLASESPPAGGTRVHRVLPPPLEHLRASYRPPEDQIPTHIAQLETIQTAGFAWAILVLVLTLSLGVLITIRVVHQEMQLARLKSDFVSFVTHELKTPLTAIRMFTETLLMGRGGDARGTRRCIEMIDREASRLSRLIQSILEYSKIETGQQVFRFAPGEMPDVVSEAVEIFRQHNPDHQLEIEINQAQHISNIRMDRSALVELFLNLLSNAYKYSQGERKRIVINLRESIDHISVDVVDNGIGISRRDQKKIFDKFFRASDYLTRQIEGTGLGLSFARYIARVHNGDIKVVSAPGQGSTFTLEILKNQIQAEG